MYNIVRRPQPIAQQQPIVIDVDIAPAQRSHKVHITVLVLANVLVFALLGEWIKWVMNLWPDDPIMLLVGIGIAAAMWLQVRTWQTRQGFYRRATLRR